ncbi:hypothetical protein [Fibrobacter sp. UWEL]|uniref:hypothetical protein n=1 Tax=Fibrobacter sp. UWEL TaxID=1896209 RepID=UPI000918C422|nr:hypothetical protein [Fibrobacter sp. UWEL]SHK87754.1 hypothetical protein SAMN05720468_108107 [Fibrobacter sp. UWEL]
MIFLFEQFPYSMEYLKSVLPLDKEGRFKDLPNGFVTRDGKLDGVGYLFNGSRLGGRDDKVGDRIVFVLPKVFLDSVPSAQNEAAKISAFGQDVPHDKNFELNGDHKDFLANLSLWVCSSIGKYREAFPDDKSMEAPNARGFSTDKACPSLIDVKNAMERFYEENKSLFVFVSKNVHSGNNRIDWRRTMRKTPFLQGDPGSEAGMTTPIYMNLVNKKKVFDLDDRLIVLFFSAMNYIEETFGFKMPKSEFYAPMRVNEFRRLLGHRGIMELRRIKHKYFADKFLRLYNIMKAFFEWGGNFSACGFGSEYLLTSKYNNVFEHMIDKLVGDDLPSKMAHLKNQKDGKEIDHLYKDQQLVFADESQKIWFIGDSKYYSDKNDIVGESVYKQFTYARNIIQYNISDLLNYKGDSKDYQGLRYRDSLTEGYSVTPNFFIRGEVPADKIFEMPAAAGAIRKDDADLWNERNRHFENRLFDRDTLLLQVYNVNFLYVLKAFTAKSSSLRSEFKRAAREKFRRNFLTLLRSRYFFWYVKLNGSLKQETFVNAHYRTLQGKLFRSGENKGLILALEQNFVDEKNSEFLALRDEIEKDCVVFNVDPSLIWEDAVAKGEPGLKRPGVEFDK